MKKLFMITIVILLSFSLTACCWQHRRGHHGHGHHGPCAKKSPCEVKAETPCAVKEKPHAKGACKH